MVKWNSSPHPISDIRDWSDLGRLELRPDFQRKEVWSDAAKVMLIDTIVSGVPMPKVFLATEIRGGKTHRVVIDGQQRLSTILAFLRDEFPLSPPYEGPLQGKVFSQFTEDEANNFLSYKIDFNEAVNPTDREIREVYARVNKYTVPLNKQELRRADYPGDFLNVSEELAVHPYLEDAKIFSPAQRRRYSDVEYISEILAAMLDGIQDKKGGLDAFYQEYASWDKAGRQKIETEFEDVVDNLKLIFGSEWELSKTRFNQRADFYSLFTAILELRREGGSLEGKDLQPLIDDLRMLDFHIEPESTVALLSEYAIKCVSQANTAASRRWRHEILKTVLSGTFLSRPPNAAGADAFVSMLSDAYQGDGMCPPAIQECAVCDEVVAADLSDARIAWPRGAGVYQMSNAVFVHSERCVEDAADLQVAEAVSDSDVRQQNLF